MLLHWLIPKMVIQTWNSTGLSWEPRVQQSRERGQLFVAVSRLLPEAADFPDFLDFLLAVRSIILWRWAMG